MIDVGGMMGDRQSDLVYIVYISISTYIIIIVESFAAELSPKNFAAPKSVCQPIKEQLSIIIISSQIGMGPRLWPRESPPARYRCLARCWPFQWCSHSIWPVTSPDDRSKAIISNFGHVATVPAITVTLLL
jgi:hypothetical protein